MASLLQDSKIRLHLQVRDRIRNLIICSGLRKGDVVPGYRELTERLGVSLVTVQRAMAELTKEGVVYGWPGKGTFLGKELSRKGRKLSQLGMVFYGTRTLFFSSVYLMEIFQGIMLQAEKLNADVRIFSIKSEGGLTPQAIAQSGVDGVLLLGVANEEYLAQVAREISPVVAVDFRSFAAPLDYVAAENARAMRAVIEHAYKEGHRRIAYLDGFSTDTVAGGAGRDPAIETSDVLERRAAYHAAMSALGLNDSATVYAVPSTAPERACALAAQSWGESRLRPTAIIAYDTSMARGLIEAFDNSGVRVPRDVSVAAAAGAGDALAGKLTLTFSRVNFVEMGRRAVELLSQRCGELRPRKAATTFIGSELVIGNSMAAV